MAQQSMDMDLRWVFTSMVIGMVALYALLRKVNDWIYVGRLGALQGTLPPGDLGWPFIGNLLSMFRTFKYGDPDSFISNYFTKRYGRAPMYRAFLYGMPGIIVTTPELCKKVLIDEELFGPGFPTTGTDLIRMKGRFDPSEQERRRLRLMVQSPISGQEAVSSFVDYIKAIAETSFEEWATRERPLEFLNEVKKAVFKTLMKVFFSIEIDQQSGLDHMEREFNSLISGVFSLRINLPGFAYHKALKARKNIVKMLLGIVRKRRDEPCKEQGDTTKDLLALLLEVSDDTGNKLSDEEIVNLLTMYLVAGPVGPLLTWAIIYLEENPQYFEKAKEEQEDIVKRRKSPEMGLTFNEIKQMKYLQKVIDETLRLSSQVFALHREAKTDVNLNGYTIPKGWRVFIWLRNVHLDPELYENPKEFNPLRWNDPQLKTRGVFLPFGAGSRYCAGADLTKLQVSIYLHYFLLNYRFHRINPKSKVRCVPMMEPADDCLGIIKKLSH